LKIILNKEIYTIEFIKIIYKIKIKGYYNMKVHSVLLAGVFVFFCIVWIPVFVIFYSLYLFGKSLLAFDQSERVGMCQTKYTMFLFFLESIATLPYLFFWSLLSVDDDMNQREKRKKDLKDFPVTFDDITTHGNVNKAYLMSEILDNKQLKKAFHFQEEITKDDYLNFFDYDKEEITRYENKVVWLYSSNYYNALIGITKKKGAIFCINWDYDKFILCRNFYEIPFEIFLNKQDLSIGQIPWRAKRQELDMEGYYTLQYYKEWLEKNNIKVKQKYLNMLK
jgi:hypothetical protein